MFSSVIVAGMALVFYQSAADADSTTRAIGGLLVTLIGVLAMLIYRDVVRRIGEVEKSKLRTDHKIDKTVRVFTGLMMATLPEKAAEIAEISEAFFRED